MPDEHTGQAHYIIHEQYNPTSKQGKWWAEYRPDWWTPDNGNEPYYVRSDEGDLDFPTRRALMKAVKKHAATSDWHQVSAVSVASVDAQLED